jgi:hypothetical protein
MPGSTVIVLYLSAYDEALFFFSLYRARLTSFTDTVHEWIAKREELPVLVPPDTTAAIIGALV